MESLKKRIESFLKKYPRIKINEVNAHELSDPNKLDPIWDMVRGQEHLFSFSENLIHLFLYVRNLHKTLFNTIEGHEACTQKTWNGQKQTSDKGLGGGGVMTVIREKVLEKSAVNMSLVFGENYPATEGEYAGKPFMAGGVSLISHPKNPNAPIMHLNVRCIQVQDKNKTIKWMGGGADLTPMVQFENDTNLFHAHMKEACDHNSQSNNYEKYKKWADDYFFIPHRKEIRGVGGVFFDFVPLEREENLNFLLDIGQQAAFAYAKIMSERVELPYDEALLEKHLYWRGRYAEFNLIYDRGTRFGLMTGGNSEAILCSLPPTVKW